MNNEVSGTRFAVSENGWVDQLFITKHFMVNAVSFRPLLLLLDGHSTHFEPKSLELARKNEIIVFCLPPHTAHVCQPLGCSFFKSLKEHWRDECHNFYQKTLDWLLPNITLAGFKKAGVNPINRNNIIMILLSTDTSASKQSTTASKYISDVYSV